MAFNDNAIVDKHAERSEESVLKTLHVFSRKNKFISHKIDGTDDYGTDIKAQLTENGQASAYDFPIQIKSKTSYSEITLDNVIHKTCSFKTSRLGYLMRHNPTTGLIVLYNEETEELFYDFTYEIVNRVKAQQQTDSWKEQQSVTIYIPVANKLTKESISSVYSRMLNFFVGQNRLINDHGKNYGLPVLSKTDTAIQTPLSILEQFGTTMFNSYMFSELVSLLSQIDRNTLRTKKMAYLGAITYAEVGDIIEADYFFKLCSKSKSEYSMKELEVLKFQEVKHKFYSGMLTRKELIEAFKEIQKTVSSSENALFVEINLLNIELIEEISKQNFEPSIINRIKDLFTKINQEISDEATKHIQFVFLSDTLNRATGTILINLLSDNHFIKAIKGNLSTPQRTKQVTEVNEFSKQCYENYRDAATYAEANDNILLLAHAQYAIASMFFQRCFAFFIALQEFDDKKFERELLSSSLSMSIKAYNNFKKLKQEPFAYEAITLSHEIHVLADKWTNVDLNDIAPLIVIHNQIERFKSFDFKMEFESVVLNVFNSRASGITIRDNLTEEHIQIIAKKYLEVKQWPNDRFDNIVEDFRNQQLFYDRCTNPDLLLQTSNSIHEADQFLEKIKYRIISKKSQIILGEGHDMSLLLQKMGFD